MRLSDLDKNMSAEQRPLGIVGANPDVFETSNDLSNHTSLRQPHAPNYQVTTDRTRFTPPWRTDFV
jgi:hypothetical protein